MAGCSDRNPETLSLSQPTAARSTTCNIANCARMAELSRDGATPSTARWGRRRNVMSSPDFGQCPDLLAISLVTTL